MPVTVALPVVKMVEDCADFSRTVAPYINQIYDLPTHLMEARSLSDLAGIYLATNPLVTAFAFMLVFAQVVFIVSEINKNYSQVDRCWSLLPTAFNLHFYIWAFANGIRSQKLDALICASLIWSIRLTFNYARKGGYNVGSEDYRWEIVKTWMSKPLWIIFNAAFISLGQAFLLFAITTPTYVLILSSRIRGYQATSEDKLFSAIMVGLVVVEFFADNQQWEFQKAKKSYQKKAKVPWGFEQKDLDRGFITDGLWRFSRHPNFAAEQAFWVTLYQWTCFETGTLINWTFIGAMSYLFLFQGSTWLTERITAKKYPEYKVYQERVGQFVPRYSGPNWKDYLEEQGQTEPKKEQ